MRTADYQKQFLAALEILEPTDIIELCHIGGEGANEDDMKVPCHGKSTLMTMKTSKRALFLLMRWRMKKK